MSGRVSVIIPTYLRADFIERAVNSVLDQTYENVEIIVVDDNGLGTEYQILTEKKLTPYIESGKIRYIPHDKNKNGSAARNTGAKNCSGEYITFLDDDDFLLPRKIEAQVRAIESSDEYSAAYTGFRIIKNSKILKEVSDSRSGNLMFQLLALQWSIGSGSNPLFRKNAFDSINGYDESFVRHQDLEFLVRFFRKNKIVSVKEILVNRYIDSRINSINYKKFADVKMKFLNTFQKDIEAFCLRDQQIIYRNQFADLACHAIQAKAFRNAFKYYKKANSFKFLSPRIVAKAVMYGFLGRKVE